MAKYIMKPMYNRKDEEGKTKMYPHMKIERRISTREVARRISNSTTFSIGDIRGVLASVCDIIALEMAEGNSVSIEGLGNFRAGLHLREGFDPEVEGVLKHRNASSIEVNTVHFRPDNELILRTRANCRLTRVRQEARNTVNCTESERLTIALNFIREHGFMTISDYASITGLERNKASRELRKWRDERHIGFTGQGSHLLYILPHTIEQEQ